MLTIAAVVATQCGELAHLAALQELRITVVAKGPAFFLQVTGLPPSLRHLEVLSCGDSLDKGPRLNIEAPAAQSASASSAPASWRPLIRAGPFGHRSTSASSTISSQPAVPAAPLALVSVVLDYAMIALPAPWPLPASCALTVKTAFLILKGEHAAAVGSDHEQVIFHCNPDTR